MRTRNIKINIFLNEEEKQMLIDKSNKAHLSQSAFFRLLIKDYSDNGLVNYDTDEIINVLTNVSNNLSKLSNQLNRLCYYDFANILDTQISNVRKAISCFQK